MINRLLTSGALSGALLLGSTGCASAPRPETPLAETRAAGSARLEAHSVAQSKLEPISRFPAREHMTPEVRMYLPRSRGSFLEVDTIAGPASVTRWLAASRVQEGPDRLFELYTRRLYVCDSALVQVGTYSRRNPDVLGRKDVEHRFMARWVSDGDEWRLSELWMRQSLTTVGVSNLASGCWAPRPKLRQHFPTRTAGIVARAGVHSRPRLAPAIQESILEWSLTDYGDVMPVTKPWGAEAFARVLPGWTAILTGEVHDEVSMRAQAPSERLVLTYDYWSAGALLGRDLWFLRFAAGPALTRFDWSWHAQPFYGGEPREERSRSTAWGLLAQGDVLITPFRGLLTQASVRYGFYGPLEVPLMSHLESSSEVEMSGLTISLGIGYALTP